MYYYFIFYKGETKNYSSAAIRPDQHIQQEETETETIE